MYTVLHRAHREGAPTALREWASVSVLRRQCKEDFAASQKHPVTRSWSSHITRRHADSWNSLPPDKRPETLPPRYVNDYGETKSFPLSEIPRVFSNSHIFLTTFCFVFFCYFFKLYLCTYIECCTRKLRVFMTDGWRFFARWNFLSSGDAGGTRRWESFRGKKLLTRGATRSPGRNTMKICLRDSALENKVESVNRP